jgi:hypothetical protein
MDKVVSMLQVCGKLAAFDLDVMKDWASVLNCIMQQDVYNADEMDL